MSRPILPPPTSSRRRAELLDDESRGNGIDYVEIDAATHRTLTVGFVRDLPTGADPYGLHTHPDLVHVLGGEKIGGIRVLDVTKADARTLTVTVDAGGDFSTYTLLVDVADLDPVLRRVPFSFMATCPSDNDCVQPCDCRARPEDEPVLDTLAKDYASFRQMLLDFSAQRHPSLSDTHAADLAMTVLELLAFEADQLSYDQDAAAQEAFLDTARRRISLRRHARFVDYTIGEGRNAFTAVHVVVTGPLTIGRGTRVLTRIAGPLPGSGTPPGATVPPPLLTPEALRTPPLDEAVVFETAHQLRADPLGNVLHVHPWGEDTFALAAGATTAWLWAEDPATPLTAVPPVVAVGDRLVLEQVRSPETGAAADADPAARWLVRVTQMETGADPAYQAGFTRDGDGQVVLTERTADAQPALPLAAVRWQVERAPDAPLCVRAQRENGDVVVDVAVGRGNVVLADHGATLTRVDVTPEDYTVADPGSPYSASIAKPLRLRVPDAPLTLQVGALDTERLDVRGDESRAVAALDITVQRTGGPDDVYTQAGDLFDSGPNDQSVVVEVDDTGHAVVRFGDGVLGRRPLDARRFLARYRIGNGTAGNVGADALVHIAVPATDASKVAAVRNPLAATGGTDPETAEHVRRIAPDAYKSRQDRAVTEADAVAAVLRVDGVRAAVAALRWTGSWYTWLVSVLPADPDDLVDTGGTHQELSPGLRAAVLAELDEVRLAGQDTDVRPPEFVPVELGLHVCAVPQQSRSALRRLVRDALLAPWRDDGTPGLLARDTLTFGRPLELGDVYAAVAAVPGVDSLKAVLLRRFGQPDDGELAAGRLDVAPWEVLRLDDDPSLPGRGVLRLEIDGGTP